jgi:hypothetical protein
MGIFPSRSVHHFDLSLLVLAVFWCGCPGESGRSQDAHVARKRLLHFFDHDEDGTISFNEFVLIVITLSVPEKDVEIVFDVMDLVRARGGTAGATYSWENCKTQQDTAAAAAAVCLK